MASIQSFYHCPLQFSSSFISSYFLLTVLVSSNSSCSTYIIFLNPFPLQLLLFHLFKVPFVSSFRLLAPATSDISSHNLFRESQVFSSFFFLNSCRLSDSVYETLNFRGLRINLGGNRLALNVSLSEPTLVY